MKTRLPSSASGFSLVEVTLAVAIASLAIITFLGLLPQGLEISRKTSLMTTTSYIMEQIVRDMENAQWFQLTGNAYTQNTSSTKLKTFRKYYNDQGAEVATDSSQLTYVVEVEYLSGSLPSSDRQLAVDQLNLLKVAVKVAATVDAKFDFKSAQPFTFTTYNHLVARTR